MKQIKYFLALTLITGLLTSCFKDIDNWYTNTADFDGRYSVATTCDEYDDHNLTIKDGNELMIYNSAANISSQIIIDSYVAVDKEAGTRFHVKGKFNVTGSPANFKASESAPNIARSETLNDDEFYVVDEDGDPIAYPSDLGVPDGAGEVYGGIQLYSRVALDEGKITPLGATTIGGNKSDGMFLAITTYCEYLIIESYQIPQSQWAISTVPEFDWRIKEGSRTNAAGWEEHWTFDGYRYTGFPEDNPSTKPPITQK